MVSLKILLQFWAGFSEFIFRHQKKGNLTKKSRHIGGELVITLLLEEEIPSCPFYIKQKFSPRRFLIVKLWSFVVAL
jgi:hypothetical protein